MRLYGSLDNYISMHRRESGLSQDELAVLLGLESRGAISQFESSIRIPELAKLLALELIFDEPIQRIFAGVADDVRGDVAGRARALLGGMNEKATADTIQRLRTLDRVAHLDRDTLGTWWSLG